MIHNPILKVLSTFQKHRVKALLIGGQACILYGAAEFSKDSDFIFLLNTDNLKKLSNALRELKAKQVYIPPLQEGFLDKGHACHFRIGVREAKGIRIDLLAKMKGCEPFEVLWARKKRINISKNLKINVIGLEDLVESKKTQRDKDWLMLKRLIEIDILNYKKPTLKKVRWWFNECRTPELLIQFSKRYPHIVKKCLKKRPLLRYAINNNLNKLNSFLLKEEIIEREKDKLYWKPLRKELEQLRWAVLKNN